MALNPAVCAALEACGLSNAALEQLLRAIQDQNNGSVTWHYMAGVMVKFELRQYGSLQNPREIREATKRLPSAR